MNTLPYTVLPGLETSASAADLADMGVQHARDHRGEEQVVAALMQVTLAAWGRIRVQAQGTPFQLMAGRVTPNVDQLRSMCPSTSDWIQATYTVWPGVALVHYSRQAATLTGIIKHHKEIAERLVPIGSPSSPQGGTRREQRLKLTEYLVGVYASVWLVIDQLLVRQGPTGEVQRIMDAALMAVSSMARLG